MILPPDSTPSKIPDPASFARAARRVCEPVLSYRGISKLMPPGLLWCHQPPRCALVRYGVARPNFGRLQRTEHQRHLSAIDDVAREPWCDKERRVPWRKLWRVTRSSIWQATTTTVSKPSYRTAESSISRVCMPYRRDVVRHNDYGGAYWDLKNRTAQRSYANSAQKLSTAGIPDFDFTGEKDYRIPSHRVWRHSMPHA